MGKHIDLTGNRYNKLTVIGVGGKDNYGKFLWECVCDCGNHTFIDSYRLKSGITKSCGCLRQELLHDGSQKVIHGLSRHRLHHEWRNIKDRCLNPKSASYKYYGGRGITICDEWGSCFKTFFDGAISHGYSENLTIERIDVNGDYCPSNCAWVPQKEQTRNTRHNIRYLGLLQTDWAKRLRVRDSYLATVRKRLNCDLEKAVRYCIITRWL